MYYLIAAVIVPALCALLCLFIRNDWMRKALVAVSTCVLFVAAGALFLLMRKTGQPFMIKFPSTGFGEYLPKIIMACDFAILLYMMYIGFKLKKPMIWILSGIQMIALGIFEFTVKIPEPKFDIHVDYLSLIMTLLVSILGPIIVIFAVGYMKGHEEHLHLKVSRQPRFFAVLLVFLAAMNGLVLTSNMMWMYFFWEITTLCSFLLISHDETEEANNNASKALWMNSLGGVAFIGGIIYCVLNMNTIDIFELVDKASTSTFGAVALPVIALLTFAGFTKSAQFPFQGWLLGAMVAPTPVSALLHSSTMVKAGVYMVVRLSPAFQGQNIGKIVACVGAISFLAGAALAVTQSNAKKVLAYSTIANLGLIIACAGIGTHIAVSAAILLIIFHALSKGMLFLCVGTIEQKIHSRDIEDMQGLMKLLPFTTIVLVIGMLTMVLPPFGMLLTKWLAIEAAANSPIVLLMLVMGSALTVTFWAKWIGLMLTTSKDSKCSKDNLMPSMKISLVAFLILTVMASILVVPMFRSIVAPFVDSATGYQISDLAAFGGGITDITIRSIISPENIKGGFSIFGFFVVILAICVYIPYFRSSSNALAMRKPFLCGENTEEDEGTVFMAPMEIPVKSSAGNYYLKDILKEDKMTMWFSIIAVVTTLMMFGVIFKW